MEIFKTRRIYMKTERKTISSRQLDLLANNPRTITKESLNRLCESIRRNGFWEHMPVAVEPVEGVKVPDGQPVTETAWCACA